MITADQNAHLVRFGTINMRSRKPNHERRRRKKRTQSSSCILFFKYSYLTRFVFFSLFLPRSLSFLSIHIRFSVVEIHFAHFNCVYILLLLLRRVMQCISLAGWLAVCSLDFCCMSCLFLSSPLSLAHTHFFWFHLFLLLLPYFYSTSHLTSVWMHNLSLARYTLTRRYVPFVHFSSFWLSNDRECAGVTTQFGTFNKMQSNCV